MMTQTEYENRKLEDGELPTKAPIGSVIIEKFHVWTHHERINGKLEEIRLYNLCLWGEYGWSYRTKPGSNVLYTMDDHGNCKSPSCFREPELTPRPA